MRCTAIGLSAALLTGSLLLAGCGKPQEQAQPPAVQPPAPAVQPPAPAVQPPAPAEAARPGAPQKGKGDPDSAQEHLRKLYAGIAIYSADYNDAMPPTLAKLMEERYAPGVALVVEGSGTAVPKTAAEAMAGQCDFLYFGAGHTDADLADDDPLACTKPGLLAGGGIAVLYADRRVEVHDQIPAKVQKAIAALGKSQ